MKVGMLALLTAASVGLFGCAHTAMRGSVAMKTSDNEAHVCMGEGEVKPGDRVRLFKNVCHSKGPSGAYSGAGAGCEKKEIGEGTVKEILNQHYSLVKFDQGIQVEEGTFVEKL